MATQPHYKGKDNPYEARKVIEEWELNFNLGNVLKYICRLGSKEPDTEIQDLEKAKDYIKYEIQRLKKERKKKAKKKNDMVYVFKLISEEFK